jgi:hypothetical protein
MNAVLVSLLEIKLCEILKYSRTWNDSSCSSSTFTPEFAHVTGDAMNPSMLDGSDKPRPITYFFSQLQPLHCFVPWFKRALETCSASLNDCETQHHRLGACLY